MPAELVYQPRQFQQISHPEERTMPAKDDLRVRSNDIGPLRRNRANGGLIDSQQETSPVAVVSLAQTGEFLAAERMERMRNPHKTHRCVGSTCTLG